MEEGKSKLQNFLLKGIKIGIYLSLLTPLVIGPIGISLSSYPKAIFFRSIIEAVFILYLCLILTSNKYFPKISILLVSVLVFNLSILVSGFFGINFYRSFWGDPERAEGIILNIHLLIFFWIIISAGFKRADWLNFLRISVFVSGVSSLAAVLQKTGAFTFYGNNLPERMSGTLSNPDFFGTYISLMVFLALFLVFIEHAKDLKFVWTAIFFLNIYALLLSSARGAWAGAIIGFLFLLPNWKNIIFKVSPGTRKFFLFLALTIAILLLIMVSNPGRFAISDNYFFWRFYSVFEFDLGSRQYVWQMAFDAWKARPILGWGPESFGYVYDKYFSSEFLSSIPEWMFFDKPHNKVLDVMTGAGAVGVACYLFMFAAVFYALFKYKNFSNRYNRPPYFFNLILLSFFICYFFQNLVYFDTISTYLIFFFTVAFINSNFCSERSGAVGKNKFLTSPFFWFAKLIFAAIFIFYSFFVFIRLNIRTVSASIVFPRNVKYEISDMGKMIAGYSGALNKNTYFDKDFRLVVVERMILALEKGWAGDDEKKVVDALSSFKPALENDAKKLDRKRSDYFRYLARICEREYMVSKNPEFLFGMEKYANEGIGVNIQKPEFYLLIGEARLFSGNKEEAEIYFGKARSLYPETLPENIAFNQKIGAIYSKAGDKKKAMEIFEKALSIDYYSKKGMSYSDIPKLISFWEGVGVMYCQDGDIDNCRRVYERAIEIYPESKKILSERLSTLVSKYKKK